MKINEQTTIDDLIKQIKLLLKEGWGSIAITMELMSQITNAHSETSNYDWYVPSDFNIAFKSSVNNEINSIIFSFQNIPYNEYGKVTSLKIYINLVEKYIAVSMDFFEKGYYLDFEGDILKNWNQVFFRETPFFDSYVSDEKFIERHFDKNSPLCKWFSKENFNEMIEDCKKDFFSNDLEVFIFSVVNVLIDDNNYEIVDAIKNYLMDNLIFENDCDKFIEFFNESHKKTDINETYKRFLESPLLKNLLEKLYLLIKE